MDGQAQFDVSGEAVNSYCAKCAAKFWTAIFSRQEALTLHFSIKLWVTSTLLSSTRSLAILNASLMCEHLRVYPAGFYHSKSVREWDHTKVECIMSQFQLRMVQTSRTSFGAYEFACILLKAHFRYLKLVKPFFYCDIFTTVVIQSLKNCLLHISTVAVWDLQLKPNNTVLHLVVM